MHTDKNINVGIVGLGLIGGSLAKALLKYTGHRISGFDVNRDILTAAGMDGIEIDTDISSCDIIIVSIYPGACINYIKNNATSFKKGALVIDCCGTKEKICSELFPSARKNGFHFMGGHPMAGTTGIGYPASNPDLFSDASMILCPDDDNPFPGLEAIKKLFLSVKFSRVIITSPQKHDLIIAHTSQLAHVVSSAYAKCGTKPEPGFSAGSFKDMTRVAHMNTALWSELFCENSKNLCNEIDSLIIELSRYRDTIAERNTKMINILIEEGNRIKTESDPIMNPERS